VAYSPAGRHQAASTILGWPASPSLPDAETLTFDATIHSVWHSKKYLYDMLRACEALAQFVEGKQFADYDDDLLLRSAVERQLMIVGEAMGQAIRADDDLAEQIEDAREIINLRNVIVHGYTVIENETIWGILQADVPRLRVQVSQLLR
jgi:uncharacterized protein with HEPN domain